MLETLIGVTIFALLVTVGLIFTFILNAKMRATNTLLHNELIKTRENRDLEVTQLENVIRTQKDSLQSIGVMVSKSRATKAEKLEVVKLIGAQE